MVTICPGGGTSGAVKTPCAEMLPIFPPSGLVTLQSTGTVVPTETEAKAVQDSAFLEETTDAGFPEESLHMTAVIAVAATIVTLAVAVKAACACAHAGI